MKNLYNLLASSSYPGMARAAGQLRGRENEFMRTSLSSQYANLSAGQYKHDVRQRKARVAMHIEALGHPNPGRMRPHEVHKYNTGGGRGGYCRKT